MLEVSTENTQKPSDYYYSNKQGQVEMNWERLCWWWLLVYPSAVFSWGGTIHCLIAPCLPRCFRILHHGVISAVLNSLKTQTLRLAKLPQAEPHSFSTERPVHVDLQDTPPQTWAKSCRVRALLAYQSPCLPHRAARLRGCFFAKGEGTPAP